ncbi:hypothetical protein ACIOYV_01080 [Pseudomonas sp. NPDC087342]|uniref:hypothetical protein n=1 Tax=Pseudomonas sp. NPDC087342 TaxID=3364437 RepID=UPI0037FDD1F8
MPYSEDSKHIQSSFTNEQYPRFNSISISNGFYCLFDVFTDSPNLENKVWLPALDLESQCEISEGLGTLVTFEDENIKICGGECDAYGGDGFISAFDKQSNTLLWFITFTETNPFSLIELIDHHIQAVSTSGVKVCLPLQRPDQAVITWPINN